MDRPCPDLLLVTLARHKALQYSVKFHYQSLLFFFVTFTFFSVRNDNIIDIGNKDKCVNGTHPAESGNRGEEPNVTETLENEVAAVDSNRAEKE